MNDTQRYIQAYKDALPRFKEKVVAALLMLIVSAVMATSATFAWISLSVSPEVSGIETTVAANGNLEIALSDRDGAAPDRSEIGDSGKNIAVKNLTWGNLVNLSDPSYGLDNMDLRPAELNTTGNLLTTPLKVVTYGTDGRVDKFSSSLKYANWDNEVKDFLVPGVPEYGVRAITTVTYKNLTGNTEYMDMVTALDENYSAATTIYMNLINDQNVLDSLKGLIGAYVDNKLNGGSPDVTEYVPALYDMMLRFDSYVEAVAGVMCDIAHMQQYPHFDKDSRKFYTVESLLAAPASELTAQKIKLPFLESFKTLRTNLASQTAKLKTYAEKVESGGTVVWGDISGIVNFMVDIPSTTIGGIPASSLGVGNATNLMGKTNKAVITKGAIKDMEQITGAKMYVSKISISVKVKGFPVSVDASVETSAATPFPLVEAKTGVDNYEGGFAGGDAAANDTYGMAIDFWLRTNSPNAYVVLEGNPIIEQVEQTDAEGNVIVDENEQPVLVDAVTGYEGANRIWNDGTLTEFSTTQGNGSCYVFYSDDPATQQKTLELVSAMKIAFIDEVGTAIAFGYMDTEHAYQEAGKVTVPLVLDTRSVAVTDPDGNAVTDINGKPIYAVAKMEQNEPKRITAVFYIDGTQLYNENVLADGKIQGQLNLQFGMNEQMQPAKDDELKYEEIALSAQVSKTAFDFDTDKDLSTQVTVTVQGLEPETVKANFIRKINEMQGSREPQITFAKSGDENKWTATMKFDSPGNYVLREVILDGVTYPLASPVAVTVEGNGIKSLSCDKIIGGNSHTIMTAENYVEATYELVMASTTNKAQDIQGVIFDDTGKQIITDFIYQAGSYTTKVKFTSSGDYTMEYLIIDGEWYGIGANLQKELQLYLGMKAEIKLSEKDFLLEGPQTVTAYVEVKNDLNEEIPGDVIASEIGSDATVEIRYYHNSASNVVLDTDLEWIAGRDRYEGQMLITVAGKYNFGVLKLGTNYITNASSPTITVISPEPPEYRGATVESYQFRPDKDAAVMADIYESASAAVSAVVVNTANGKEYTVEGNAISTVNKVTKWQFTLPKVDVSGNVTEGGSQDGNWQFKQLKLTGVYVDNEYYDEENPLVWTLADMESGNLTTKVVGEIHVTVKEKSQGATAFTTKFMGESVVDDLQITISDFAGAPIDGVSDVKLRYQLVSRDTTAYSTNSQIPHELVQSVNANLVSGSSTVYQAENVKLVYPGRYATGIQFTLSGTTYIAGVVNEGEETNYNVASLPAYTVAWEKAVIKVTGTNPAPGTSFTGNVGSDSSASEGTVSNTFSDYAFSVNFQYKTGCSSSMTPSKVTMQISNAGNFKQAVFTMSSSEVTTTYTFTPSKTSVEQSVGTASGLLGTFDRKWLAPSAKKFSTVEITDNNGMVYTFNLDNPISAHTPH